MKSPMYTWAIIILLGVWKTTFYLMKLQRAAERTDHVSFCTKNSQISHVLVGNFGEKRRYDVVVTPPAKLVCIRICQILLYVALSA